MNPAASTVGIRLLGPVQAVIDGDPVSIGSRIQRSLLAMLALEVNRAVASDRLLDGAWQGESGGTRSALHVHISNLRAVLEPGHQRNSPFTVLRSAGGGYLLSIETRHVDAHEFLRLVGEGLSLREHDPMAAIDVLSRAEAMFAGPPLQGLEDHNFAPPVITRLIERRLEAVASRIDAQLELERYDGLPAELAELVAAHPTRETFVRQQMVVLANTGRHPDALRAYASYRTFLADELGLDPSPELQAVEASILAQEPIVPTAAAGVEPGELAEPAAVMTMEVIAARRLWLEHTARMHQAFATLYEVATGAIARAGGRLIDDNGARLVSAFHNPIAAVVAAVACQRATEAADFKVPIEARVAVCVCPRRQTAPAPQPDWALAPAASPAGRQPGPAPGPVPVLAAAPDQIADRCFQLTAYAPPGTVLVPETTVSAAEQAGYTVTRYGTIRSHGHIERTELYLIDDEGLRSPTTTLAMTESLSLPRPSVDLIGRDREIGELRRLVTEHLMVSITGPAGVGKTALAIEVAWRAAHELDDGAVLVDLSDARPDSVVAMIASALDIRTDDDATLTTTLGAVAGRDLLLVLDNGDHVTAAVADLARHCEQHGVELKILVTSRRATGFRGERVYPIGPLAIWGPGDHTELGPANQLFVERARQAGYQIGDTPAERARVARICAQLDGLPLAVELTAARLRATSLRAIEQQLAQAGPLATTSGPQADGRDLSRAIAWSYDLLSESERAAFRHLGVFRGSYSVEAAASVAGRTPETTLSTLSQLADSSLVMAVENEHETRFRTLETVRAFAVDRLGNASNVEEARRRHADYFRALARAGERELCGPHEPQWVARFIGDFENLIGAFEWYVGAAAADDAIDMATSLWNFALQRAEGVRFFAAVEAAMSHPVFTDHPRRSELLGVAANGAWLRGDPLAACELAVASIAAEDAGLRSSGSGRALIPARMALLNAVGSGIEPHQVEPRILHEAGTAFESMHEICRRAGDPYWLVFPYVLASFARALAGDHQAAQTAASKAVSHAIVSGSMTAMSWALLARAGALQPLAPEPAVDACQRSLRRASDIGSQFPAALAVSQLAILHRQAGAHAKAAAHLLDGLGRWDRLGNAPHAWHAIREVCLLADDMGRTARIEPLVNALEAQSLVFPHDSGDMRRARSLARQVSSPGRSAHGTLGLRAALDFARADLDHVRGTAAVG